MHREQKVGTGAGIRCQLLQGEVEDVSGSGLNGSIEPFGVFRLVVLIGGDHTTPPQGTPGLPCVLCPVGLLPPVEVRKGSPESFAILVSLRLSETLPGVLVDVLAVLLGAEAVEEAQSRPLSSLWVKKPKRCGANRALTSLIFPVVRPGPDWEAGAQAAHLQHPGRGPFPADLGGVHALGRADIGIGLRRAAVSPRIACHSSRCDRVGTP